eukprot:CAMPEP_0113941472 /NCGR_PEP_ID=MMETSP1339-20121228/7373_1 /TAXON_ID=94617 /ORGANISM="Fibrocapsa japonica" /LENGTH=177 /DNA_ID=CAMNT_0000945623 /DNA_START=345 /DNA_END=879 /DNA_ORIENTATION=+ /assembly_acc=CAM_ASM_000762
MERDVRLPSGKIASFDVMCQDHPSLVVFNWDTRSNTTTLIKEYFPGGDGESMMHGVVAGLYEHGKNGHHSAQAAAACELEEEAHLVGGTWYSLLEDGATVPMDKYTTNKFHAFLVLDCETTQTPAAMDDEEFIIIEKGFTQKKVMSMIARGQLSMVSAFTCMLGFNKLRELGCCSNA